MRRSRVTALAGAIIGAAVILGATALVIGSEQDAGTRPQVVEATPVIPATTKPSPTARLSGRLAFAAPAGSAWELFAMNLDGSTGPVRLTALKTSVEDPVWSPDGTRIAFVAVADGNREIFVVNADGTGLVRLTHDEPRPSADDADTHPRWSPDGQRISFYSHRNGSGIYLINVDGSGQRLLAPAGSGGHSWSPDGKRIALVTPDGNIAMAGVDGQSMTRLTSDRGLDAFAVPTWSPDGSRIAFAKAQSSGTGNDRYEIFAVYVDGSGRVSLSKQQWRFPSQVAWSPDGTRLAIASSTEGERRPQLHVMNSDGTGVRHITDLGHPYFDWSPDGQRIAVARVEGTLDVLHLVNADGSGSSRLFPGIYPDWSSTSYATAPVPVSPAPEPAHTGSLAPGRWVEVAGTGSCLNFRMTPGVAHPSASCILDGFVGYVAAGPQFADGLWWWGIAGQGWAAESWLHDRGVAGFPGPSDAGPAPQGKLAYIGQDGALWTVLADGAGAKRLSAHAFHISGIEWSPLGDLILIDALVGGTLGLGGTLEVWIVDEEGQRVRTIKDATAPSWSPDGKRIAYTKYVPNPPDHSYEQTILDLDSGATISIKPSQPMNLLLSEGPRWSADGTLIAYYDARFRFLNLSRADGGPGPSIEVCAPPCTRIANLTWAPEGHKIAWRASEEGGIGWLVVYNVDSQQELSRVRLPEILSHGASRDTALTSCPTSPPYRSLVWLDGETLLISSPCAAINNNGVWRIGASGGSALLLSMWQAGTPTVSPDGRYLAVDTSLWFEVSPPSGAAQIKGRHIWITDVEGTSWKLIAEGRQPAWQP